MSVVRSICASLATRSVFARFAALSEEDKDKIKRSVLQKLEEMRGEGGEGGEAEPTEEAEQPAEGQVDESAQSEPVEPDVAPEEEESESEPTDETPEGEEAPEEVEPDPAEPEEPESEPAPVEEPEEGESQYDQPLPDAQQDEMRGIIDGLVDEVRVIKEDNQITQGETLNLFKKMMEMVNMLVLAKPPKRGKKASIQELADRVAASVE